MTEQTRRETPKALWALSFEYLMEQAYFVDPNPHYHGRLITKNPTVATSQLAQGRQKSVQGEYAHTFDGHITLFIPSTPLHWPEQSAAITQKHLRFQIEYGAYPHWAENEIILPVNKKPLRPVFYESPIFNEGFNSARVISRLGERDDEKFIGLYLLLSQSFVEQERKNGAFIHIPMNHYPLDIGEVDERGNNNIPHFKNGGSLDATWQAPPESRSLKAIMASLSQWHCSQVLLAKAQRLPVPDNVLSFYIDESEKKSKAATKARITIDRTIAPALAERFISELNTAYEQQHANEAGNVRGLTRATLDYLARINAGEVLEVRNSSGIENEVGINEIISYNPVEQRFYISTKSIKEDNPIIEVLMAHCLANDRISLNLTLPLRDEFYLPIAIAPPNEKGLVEFESPTHINLSQYALEGIAALGGKAKKDSPLTLSPDTPTPTALDTDTPPVVLIEGKLNADLPPFKAYKT